MIWKDILPQFEAKQFVGDASTAFNSIIQDSRKVEKGSCYVAIKGLSNDGHAFIQNAIDSGASSIVCEVLPEEINADVAYIQVDNASVKLGHLASLFYGNPSEKLTLVGITGTNGKTTTVNLLYETFLKLGYSVALISTIRIMLGKEELHAEYTTPDVVTLNKLMAKMVESGIEFCFMEVSSHAIHQHRIEGLQFKIALFSNITHDHLDYHNTFSEYLNVKKAWFDNLPSTAISIVNRDDKNGMVMVQNTKSTIKTYSLNTLADYRANIIANEITGLELKIGTDSVSTRLIGEFNAYNFLVAYATGVELGLDAKEYLIALSSAPSVNGRFEYIVSKIDKITAIVDYAHTPDALENVLKNIVKIKNADSKIVTLIGCGGNRDKAKRPIMAQIAAKYSDKTILTSDNPRNEDPEEILNEMELGIKANHAGKYLRISDRRAAIKTASHLVAAGDVMLVAGKGHETYQEIKGVKYPFDDKVEIEVAFKESGR